MRRTGWNEARVPGLAPATLVEPVTRLPLFVVVVLALLVPGSARASEQFGDLDVAFLSLKVNARGEALVSYRTSGRVLRHVYVWGAINAIPPDPRKPQVRFRYDYTGGWRKNGRQTWPTGCACPSGSPPRGQSILLAADTCRSPEAVCVGTSTTAARSISTVTRAPSVGGMSPVCADTISRPSS